MNFSAIKLKTILMKNAKYAFRCFIACNLHVLAWETGKAKKWILHSSYLIYLLSKHWMFIYCSLNNDSLKVSLTTKHCRNIPTISFKKIPFSRRHASKIIKSNFTKWYFVFFLFNTTKCKDMAYFTNFKCNFL